MIYLKKKIKFERNEEEEKLECYNYELCKALMAADIPLEKLNNPFFKQFLTTYIKVTQPTPNALRKGFVIKNKNDIKLKIKNKLHQKIFGSRLMKLPIILKDILLI